LLAFDLPDKEMRNRVRQGCWDAGFATLPCGPRSLRFRPPLTFTEEEVSTALDILHGVLIRN
jgi:L-lysine 6-transaminase